MLFIDDVFIGPVVRIEHWGWPESERIVVVFYRNIWGISHAVTCGNAKGWLSNVNVVCPD